MVGQKIKRLNRLEQALPEGMLVDTAWLKRQGYSRQLWNHYVVTGRLEQPARGLFRRPRGSLNWQQVVTSLQTLLEYPLVAGGRTALELQGFAHYLPQDTKEVHLYGPKPPPGWLFKLPVGVRFIYHNDRKLFRDHSITQNIVGSLTATSAKGAGKTTDPSHGSVTVQPWGQWDWPLTLSTPERAVLELLDELPDRESFHQVDKLMEGLSNLSPRRLQKLLADCRNVKVKRLFFYFADRHKHAWLKRLSKDSIDLGKGKRMLAKHGKLDRTYQITVPEDLDGVR
jgi:hypothetical protein